MAKRESKISCFITDDARTALDEACVEYDSPQGKLINRMILNFCKLQDIKPKAKRVTKIEFDFSSWPNSVDPKIFKDLCKSRKVKMTQSYIDRAAKHLHELHGMEVSVDEAISIAASRGWQGFKAEHVLNELGRKPLAEKEKVSSVGECISLLQSGALKSIKDIQGNVRKEIETMYRIKKLSPEICGMLDDIGLVIN